MHLVSSNFGGVAFLPSESVIRKFCPWTRYLTTHPKIPEENTTWGHIGAGVVASAHFLPASRRAGTRAWQGPRQVTAGLTGTGIKGRGPQETPVATEPVPGALNCGGGNPGRPGSTCRGAEGGHGGSRPRVPVTALSSAPSSHRHAEGQGARVVHCQGQPLLPGRLRPGREGGHSPALRPAAEQER